MDCDRKVRVWATPRGEAQPWRVMVILGQEIMSYLAERKDFIGIF